jgi:hypothetical protein
MILKPSLLGRLKDISKLFVWIDVLITLDKKGLKTIIPDDLTSLESRPNFCFTPTSPGLITAQEVNVTKSVKTSAN